MTEQEWLSGDATSLGHWLGRFPERQRLLFICACAGIVNPLFPEECASAIDFITEIADGVRQAGEVGDLPLANLSEGRHPLGTIRRALSVIYRDGLADFEAGRAVGTIANDFAYFRIRAMSFESNWRTVREDTQREVKGLLWRIHLCIFNPFHPVPFLPAWRTEHTVGLASKMYDERNFAAMPILADALEEAGCENADVLTHCREPGSHARGCWVVDGVLGKR